MALSLWRSNKKKGEDCLDGNEGTPSLFKCIKSMRRFRDFLKTLLGSSYSSLNKKVILYSSPCWCGILIASWKLFQKDGSKQATGLLR